MKKPVLSALTGLLICASSSLLLNPKPPSIKWSSPSIEKVMYAGQSMSLNVSFSSSEDLGPVEVFVVPELVGVVSAEPAQFSSVSKNVINSVALQVGVPPTTPLGSILEGTVHIKSQVGGRKTIPTTLKVVIRVIIANATIGPDGGEIVGVDEVSRLLVPPNALDQPTLITLLPLSEQELVPPLPDFFLFRSAVELGPDDLVFRIPARLTLPISPFESPGAVLQLNFFNPETQFWQDTGNLATVSVDGATASADVSHFTRFGLVAPVCPPPPVPALVSPQNNATIPQNSAPACLSDPIKGAGYEISFSWTDSPGACGFHHSKVYIFNPRLGTRPGNATFFFDNLTSPSFELLRCNEFIPDDQLTGWQWVIGGVDLAGNEAQSAPRNFEFAPCRLSDGRVCGSLLPPSPLGGGPAGGLINSVAVDPKNATIAYVGTDGAGVFKSTNGGQTWAPSGLTNHIVNTIVLDPSQPSTLYSATSGGVFKSSDAGLTWISFSSGLINTLIGVVAIDPLTPTTLYAGVGNQGGIFKSTNGGQSWTAVNNGLTNRFIQDISVDPSRPAIVYAGTEGGVFKTIDGGASWGPFNAGLTNTVIRGLAIDPSSSATVYATTDAGVFKSVDGALNWAAVLLGFTPGPLVIDPTSPATVYVGSFGGVFKTANGGETWTAFRSNFTNTGIQALAINPTGIVLYAGTNGSGLFRSTDSGGTWNPSSSGITNAHVKAVAVNPVDPAKIYTAIDGGGVFKSTNGGESWIAVNSGLFNIFVFALAIDPSNPSTVYVGGGGGVFKTTDEGQSWTRVHASTGVFALAIDPSNPTVVYAGSFPGGVFKSVDAGQTWTPANSGLTDAAVRTLAVDSSDPAILYAGTESGFFKSSTGGQSWIPSNAGMPNTAVLAIAVNPSNTATVYAGTLNGVFRSTDGGQTWNLVLAGPDPIIHALVIDPSNPATVYAGGGLGVFKTSDSGQNWTLVDSSLAIAAFAIDPLGGAVYAGTFQLGVFKSIDGAITWQPTGAN